MTLRIFNGSDGVDMEFFNDKRDWFFQKRLGMFIHWGIYSVNGLHEQELWRYARTPSEYYSCAERFTARHFNPAAWLDLMQENGFEYLVFTAKHHDGFCLFDTAETECKVTNTPFGRDVFALLADECHKRDFPLEAYYSVVDWRHPAYPNLGGHHEIKTDPQHHNPAEYIAFVQRQVRELCSNYGELHGIWWDMNSANLQDASMNDMVRKLQPSAVVNNRGFGPGDFSTPEREFIASAAAFETPTEACESVGQLSWGYRRDENYFTVRFLEEKIARTLASGGNFLLNAGPDAEGDFTPEAIAVIKEVGQWYKRVREALIQPLSPVYSTPECPVTQSADNGSLYWILCQSPVTGKSYFPQADRLPELTRATLLNTGETLPVENGSTYPGIPSCQRAIAGIPVDANLLPVVKLDFSDSLPLCPPAPEAGLPLK